MKKIFLYALLLFSLTPIVAQNYVFNAMTKYIRTSDNNEIEIINYVNSANDSYHLKIHKSQESLSATLFDYENLKIHSFDVITSNSNNEVFFEFHHTKSMLFDQHYKKVYPKHEFTFETISKKDSISKVVLKIFKNSKRKKPLVTYNLEIKDYDANLFHPFRISAIHPYEFVYKLNPFKNGIVVNASGNSLSGKSISTKLNELKSVNFEINVPQK